MEEPAVIYKPYSVNQLLIRVTEDIFFVKASKSISIHHGDTCWVIIYFVVFGHVINN